MIDVEATARRMYPRYWDKSQLAALVEKGKLSAEAYESITGEPYAEPVRVYDFTGMTAQEVVRSLSYRPTLDEYRQACDWLKLPWDEAMTRAELRALIDEAAAAEVNAAQDGE